MADIITIEECITRLDAIRHEVVSNSRDHFALSAGIAALYEMEKDAPAVNRWIPVDDDFPEQSGFYLAYFTFKDGTHATDIAYINTGCNLGSITHWMPMPEPPEVFKQ